MLACQFFYLGSCSCSRPSLSKIQISCLSDYAAAVNRLDLIFSIDLKLVYIKAICNTYPPITKIVAFNGLEKVIIKLTWGGARLLPMITNAAIGIQA
jgi:hypothetical protein